MNGIPEKKEGADIAAVLVMHLSAQEKAVLQVLMDHVDSHACIEVASGDVSLQEQVCQWSGYGKSTVYRAFQRLLALGLIKMETFPSFNGRSVGKRCLVIPGMYADELLFKAVMAIRPDLVMPDGTGETQVLRGLITTLQDCHNAWYRNLTLCV